MNRLAHPPHRHVALVALLVLCAGQVLAAPSTTENSTSKAVRAAAEHALQQHYALPGNRVETASSPLDARLQLATCNMPLQTTLPERATPAPRMTVQVRCPQAPGWNVRVPVQLHVFRQVLVTNRPLVRGDGILASDVHSEERDITRLGYGYIDNLSQAAQRSLARPLISGSVLTPGALGGRDMVRAGDHVQMVAQVGSIEVRATGVALGSGDNGARLRVRNENSGKIVDAMVSAPGVVLALP